MTCRNGYESVAPASGTSATHPTASQGVLSTSGVFRKGGCREAGDVAQLDRLLWTIYRQSGPCGGLRGAVDVEDQAVLRSRVDLKLFVEGESAVDHSSYILQAPAAKADPRAGYQLHTPWRPAGAATLPSCPPPAGVLTSGDWCWHPSHLPRAVVGVGLRTAEALVVLEQTECPGRHSPGGLYPSRPPADLSHDPGGYPLQAE